MPPSLARVDKDPHSVDTPRKASHAGAVQLHGCIYSSACYRSVGLPLPHRHWAYRVLFSASFDDVDREESIFAYIHPHLFQVLWCLIRCFYFCSDRHHRFVVAFSFDIYTLKNVWRREHRLQIVHSMCCNQQTKDDAKQMSSTALASGRAIESPSGCTIEHLVTSAVLIF